MMHQEVRETIKQRILYCVHIYKFLFQYRSSISERVEDAKQSGMSGIKLFLLMLVGALALIACVVIAIMLYQKHQENSRKRFY